jgi:hypothetical protein
MPILGLALFGVAEAPAQVTHYVNVNSTNPVMPYTNWETAATIIQEAIGVASSGDLVLVTNGVYATGVTHFVDTNNQNATIMARIQIPSGVAVSSVNGPANTIIQGSPYSCACLAGNASLSGFTLTNGTAFFSQVYDGGGAYCQTTNALISNCVICSNAAGSGGGVYLGTLTDCVVSNNLASYQNYFGFGGGTYGSILNRCTLVANSVLGQYNTGFGGAAFGGILNDCILASNLVNYTTSSDGYGGAGCSNVMNNCLIIYNHSGNDGTAVAQGSTLVNCTICYNGALSNSDSSPLVTGCALRNCVLYGNIYPGNYVEYTSVTNFQDCCLEPEPFHPLNFEYGNNITNSPLFVNPATGDFHLQSNSPCIHSGNNAFVTVTNDLDGNPRIVGGTVDIGAYEYQTPTSIISYAWLEEYGLPTDGSADFADTDGNGMNNYQKWIAGLNPTNPPSILAMATVVPTNNPAGLAVTWESVSNIIYYLQRSSDLSAQPAFSTIQTNITGQTNTTTYVDTNAISAGSFFYRVGVR